VGFLETGRLLATLGVLWVHVTEVQGHSAAVAATGRFGTSFYLIALVLLGARAGRGPTAGHFGSVVRLRAERLLLPFVAWCAIYAGVYGLDAWRRGDTLADLTRWWGPFAGTARHLWFLPFGFAASVAASWLMPRLTRLVQPRLLVGLLAATALCYWLCYGVLFFAIDRTWLVAWHLHRLDRWVEEVPLLVAAFSLSVALSSRTASAPCPHLAALGFGAFLAAEVTYCLWVEPLRGWSGTEGRFVAHGAALALVVALSSLSSSQWTSRMARAGRATYFVFLSHVLLLDALGKFWTRPAPLPPLVFSALTTLTVLLLAVALRQLLRALPVPRWLVP
jgi:fucose 4-O-acetylase-like acetyltransferase